MLSMKLAPIICLNSALAVFVLANAPGGLAQAPNPAPAPTTSAPSPYAPNPTPAPGAYPSANPEPAPVQAPKPAIEPPGSSSPPAVVEPTKLDPTKFKDEGNAANTFEAPLMTDKQRTELYTNWGLILLITTGSVIGLVVWKSMPAAKQPVTMEEANAAYDGTPVVKSDSTEDAAKPAKETKPTEASTEAEKPVEEAAKSKEQAEEAAKSKEDSHNSAETAANDTSVSTESGAANPEPTEAS